MSVYTSWIASTSTPFGLGRHVEHDIASLEHKFRLSAPVASVSTVWAISQPILNQGNHSSCVGNAFAQCMNTDYFKAVRANLHKTWLTETDALDIYSRATHLDGFGDSNYYPPNDQGSSGLGGAKALQQLGYIDRYDHAMDWDSFRAAIQEQPVCVGTVWTNQMFTPDEQGYVTPGDLSDPNNVAGGHEYLCRGIVYETETVTFTNSWGVGWGQRGTFHMKFADFQALLDQQGDVVVPHGTGLPN